MAGYDGYSMSNNAREAYDCGYMPKSKWTKANMIEAINTYIEENELDKHFDKLNDMSRELLFNTFFGYKEWHHTSSKYNRTDFYGVDEFCIMNMTDKEIEKLISENKVTPKAKEEPQGMYLCEFKHWTGTRRHPKCKIIQAIGEIKGKMFYSSEYGNKRITTEGFKIIKEA